MQRLHSELQKLAETWIVGEEREKLKDMIKRAQHFCRIPAARDVLTKRSTSELLDARCGHLQIGHGSLRGFRQDAPFVSIVACKALVERVAEFLQEPEEMEL